MRKQLLTAIIGFLLLLLTGITSYAQLTGTKSIPGDYASISLAISDLNTNGVGAGGVTFNILPGYTETITAPLSITATGTVSNPIIFQKNGAGANPIVTAYVGTSTPGSAVQDGMWNLVGSDFVTIDGINLTDPNSTNPASMEYGYAMFKSSVTNGCQNNTIKNCIITLSRTNNASGTAPAVEGSRAINIMNALVTAQTTVLVPTAATGSNSYNKIYSNTLQNCNYGVAMIGYAGATPFTLCDFGNDIGGSSLATGNSILNYGGATGATNPSAAVRTLAQYDLNVSYNTVNNNNGSGVNHVSTLRGIYLNTAVSANSTVSYNTLTINGGSTTSQISVIESAAGSTAAGNTININNNTIQNCTWSTATSGLFYGIYNSSSAFTVNIFGNLITNMTIPNTGNLYGIAGQSPANLNIYNNEISYITKTVSGTLYAIQGSTAIVSVHDNNVHHLTESAGANALYGYYNLGSPTNETYYNNTFNNFTCNGTGGVFGIYTNTVAGIRNVYSNTIYNFSASGGGPVYAIYGAASSPNIYKNNIYNLSSGTATGIVYGIYNASGTTANIYNNFVSDLKTPAATGLDAIRGIYISGGTTANIFYNTVYLNATSTGTGFGCSSINTSTTPVVDMRNNIFVNVSTPTGTGIAAVYRRSSTTLTTYSSNSNANAFYSGAIEDATHTTFYDGTATYNFAAFKTLVGPARDALSFRELPPYVNVATAPYDLHLQTTIATQCESGALRITTPIAIPADIDENARFGETGYTGSGSAPDIGADEGNFTLLDINPPVIVYTALANTSSTAARTITATITDASSVGTGVNQPVLYWAINAGAYTGPVAPTSIAGNLYTYTLGAGVILGDVVKYYFVAQDQATPTNVGSAPLGAIVTANPPVASAPPATPSSYTVVGCISGIKTVGSGGDYLTLTAAITALNNSELCGPLTLNLTDASYTSETLPLVINSNSGSSATNTVTIKPAIGVNVSISGASATNTMFKVLNSYTVIEGSNSGGTSRNLTITNTSATSPNVLLINSSGTTSITGVTVKNTIIINGANTSTAVIISDVAGTAGYFTNITLQNNSIQKAYIGIYALATVATGNGNGLLITGNDLNTSGANSIRLIGVYAQGLDGVTISNNQIGNIVNANAESPKGIWLATGTNSAIISGNTISNLSLTNTGAFALTGIYVNPGITATNISVNNNTISTFTNSGTTLAYAGILSFSPNTSITNNSVSGLTQNGASAFWGIVQSGAVNSNCSGNTVSGLLTATTGTVSGINIQGLSTGVNVFNNKVSNIKNTNTSGYGCNGIMLSSSSVTSNMSVYNNFIYDVAAYGYAGGGSADNGYGMIITSGGGYNIYHNSISMNTNQTSDGWPAAMNITSGVTAVASIDMRDNIFANTQTVGTDRYAIYSGASANVFTNSNYNNYFTTGPNIGFLVANTPNLAAWQSATGKDLNSVSGDPLFINATDLHLNTALNSPAKNAGIAIPAITTDIDGDTRNNPPDMGADDYSLTPTVVTNAASVITGTTATINGTINANNETVVAAFEYGTTLSFGTTVTATPSPVTGNTVTSISYGLTGLVPNTTYYFQAKGTIGSFVYNGVPPLSFTTPAILPLVTTITATAVTSTGASMNGTVNANNASTVTSFEYGLTAAYGITVTAVPSPVTGVSATSISYALTGLIPNTTYHYRAVGINSAGTANGLDLTFTTAAILPTVVTNIATSVTGTGAVLNGTVNANNASTAVTFEYGLTTAYGTSVTAIPSPVTGTTVTSVTYTVSGLAPSTTYHFRAVGVNIAGTANGLDQSFTTSALAPLVVTTLATPIGSNTATLNGTVNANNQSSTVTFEYGLTTAYGTILSGTPATVTGYSATPVSAAISGLSLATSYHYRAVAVNATGTTYGNDMTFTTGCVTPAAAGTITGPAAICQSTLGVAYSVGAITDASTYVWSLPAGASIATGSGTNSITVDFSGSAATGSISVYGSSGCASGASSSATISISSRPLPVISGPASACINSTGNVYSTATGMTGYTWTISAGGTIAAGSGTNSISVTWNTGGTQSVSVNYSNAGSCVALAPTVYNVNVNPLPVPVIAGAASACVNSAGNIYSTTTAMTGYTWMVSAGGSITAGAGTNSITVTWNTAGSQDVSVNYVNGNGCTAATPTVMNVTVNSLPVPTITGLASVCTGTTGVTYTTETGMTGYNWTISSGGIITAGAGTNAITVSWNTVGPQNVNVNYVNGNGCTATVQSVKVVTVNPLPVPTIAGLSFACVGNTGINYTTEAGMTGYTWSVSAGGTITAGAGTNVITVTWNTAGTKSVFVNYINTNGCTALANTVYSVNVAAGSSPTITGPVELCAGSAGVVYTTQPGFANYVWTISYGGIITAGLNSNQVTVDWGTAGLRTISVNYQNASGCSAVSPFVYNVNVLSVPVPIITGNANVCQGTTGVAYTTQLNYTNYSWTISSGGTITSGAGTNAITVSWITGGNQTVSVSYTNSLGCEAEEPTVFNVNVTPKPAAAGSVTGPSQVCAGTQGVVYSVTAIAEATSYNWTVPSGATIVSGAVTNSITIDFAATATPGIIKVNGVNDCGSGTSSPNFNVVVNPIPPTPVITQHGDTLTSSANTGNQWYLDGVIIPGATGKQHVAVYSGNYTVVVTLTGCSSAPSNAILVLPVSVADFEVSHSFDVYPNPNHGQFDIKVVTGKPIVLNIEIYNSLGSLQWKQEKVNINGSYTAPVELNSVPPGVYMVVLRNKNINVMRKIVIMK